MDDTKTKPGLLYGGPAIAAAVGLSERQTRYLLDKGTIPSFKINGKVATMRSDVENWLLDCAARARREAKQREGDAKRSAAAV